MSTEALQRNLRLYPWLHVGRNALFWLPVFVLYFSSLLAPADVLRLEAFYYVGVVLLEVPSGYLSDRLGRKPVLIVAAVAWVAGSAVLATGGDLAWLAGGQLLLAAGMAFQSGTDSSLLYDTLLALDRPDELAEREARAQSAGFASMAVSALVGGAVGGLALWLGHGLSAIAGLVAVGAALGMAEPPRAERAAAPWTQLRRCAGLLSEPVLRWTLAVAIAFTVWIHIPYELMQPWLEALVSGLDRPDYAAAPLTSGIVSCIVMGLAAVAGPRGPKLAASIGPIRTVLAAWVLLLGVTACMAAAVHPALLLILAFRSVPTAIANPVLAALAHPRLPSSLRATWLSLQSLAGRLAFAMALTLASAAVGASDGWTIEAMRAVLWPAAGVGAGVALVLLALAPREDSTV